MSNITMIAKVCDRESRRDTCFENRLVYVRIYIEVAWQHLSCAGVAFKFTTCTHALPDVFKIYPNEDLPF